MRRRIAMAIEAPSHAERLHLIDLLHCIDATMARHATDSASHVGAVVEVNIVGQIMNPHPLDGFAGLETLAHRGQFFALGLDGAVTVHAGGRGRDVGLGGGLDAGVAVAAIDAKIARMQRMTVGHGLLRGVADGRHFRGEHAGNQHRRVDQSTDRQQSRSLTQVVGPFRKDEFFGVGVLLGIVGWFALLLVLVRRFRARLSPAWLAIVLRLIGGSLCGLAGWLAWTAWAG